MFKNSRGVYLRNLTSIPENAELVFENNGGVLLPKIKSIIHRGKKVNLNHIDDSTMIIKSSKKVDDFIVHRALYFKGCDFADMRKCYIAEKGKYFAHGDTIEEAIEDVNFKYLQENLNKTESED